MQIMIDSLKKWYGEHEILKDISMTIGTGMFGLLGRNGAGKTTLMRILSTLSEPTGGKITMKGIPIQETQKIRKMVGYLPQDFSFYPGMSIYETMEYLSVLSEIPAGIRKPRIVELLEQVNLWEDRKKKVKTLSGGMKRRLGIAQALLHDPEVLIADEPTAGLDPEERLRFYNLLEQFSQDKTVIVSTHIVSDVETVCGSVAVLDSGSLLYCGSIGGLAQNAEGRVYEISVARDRQEQVRGKYHVLSSRGQAEDLRIRILSDHYPELGNPDRCVPTVEDGYMELLRKMDKGEANDTAISI